MYRDLLLIAVALLTWGIGEGMFFNFDPLYLQELGADPLRIGAILGAVGISMTVTQIPAGYLADRFGRRGILIAAWVVGTLGGGIMAAAGSLSVFVIGRLIYGLTAWVATPLNSYITQARGKFSVGRAITLISAAFFAGFTLGPLLGGFVGQRWGLAYTYRFAAILFALSTGMIFFIRRQPTETLPQGARPLSLLKSRHFLSYLVLVFLSLSAVYLPQPLSPNFLQNQRGLNLSQIGQLIAISGVGIVFLNLLIGQLPAGMGFLLSQAAVAVFALLIWRGTGMAWYALGYFFVSGYRVARNLATAQVRELVHPAVMGLAYGITETVGLSATILAPLLAGFLYAQEPEWMYPASILFIAIAMAINARFILRRYTYANQPT